MSIRAVMVEELRRIFRRGSKTALILFGIPVVYTILFGMVYSSERMEYIPTLIYDQDNSPASRTLIQAFADSERYHIAAQVTNQEDKERYMRENAAIVSVVIPPDFSKNIKLGLATEVLVETNAVNLLYANTVLTTSQEIVQTFAAGTGQRLVQSLGQMPDQALRTVAPIRLGLRIANNPTLGYSAFVLPGLGVNGLQLAIVLATCTVLTRLYPDIAAWRGTSSAVIVAGKLLPYWLCGLAGYVASVLLMVVLFQIPLKGSVLSLLLIGAAFTFAAVGIGALVSAVAPSEVIAVLLPMLYIMPSFLFSGYSWPHMAMNAFSRAFSATMPLTYTVDTMRDIMLAGYAPSLWRDAVILCAFGAGLTLAALAVFAFRRSRLAGAASAGEVR